MLYQDNLGYLLSFDEVNELTKEEIELRHISLIINRNEFK
jgi:hypothetical protein